MTSTKESIELSKYSIKFSYLRFLSDSAGGYILVLILLMSYYHSYPILFLDLKDLKPIISNEVKLFILVLLFFLSTPLGLMINSFSWFLLGCLTIRIENLLAEKTYWFLRSTIEASLIDKWKVGFGIDSGNWYSYSETIETILMHYHPSIMLRYDHVEGVKIFSRNLAMLSILSIINAIANFLFSSYSANHLLFIIGISICLASLFIVLSALIGFYHHSVLFCSVHAICLKTDCNYINELKKEADSANRNAKLNELVIKVAASTTI